MRPVDYALVYRLEDERFARERAYVCPFWDWVKDFRDRIPWEGGWDCLPSKSGRSGVLISGEDWTAGNDFAGEIPWR